MAVMLLLAMVGNSASSHHGDLKAQALPTDVMHSAFADRFRMLHGVSSILYLVQRACLEPCWC